MNSMDFIGSPPPGCANRRDRRRNFCHMQPPPDAGRRVNWNGRKRPSDRLTVTAALHSAPPWLDALEGMILEPCSFDLRYVAMQPLQNHADCRSLKSVMSPARAARGS